MVHCARPYVHLFVVADGVVGGFFLDQQFCDWEKGGVFRCDMKGCLRGALKYGSVK